MPTPPRRRPTQPTLLDEFDYGMHGKVFKYERDGSEKKKHEVNIYISFGGLLLLLEGEQKQLELIEPNMSLYCLMRRRV